MPHHSYLKPLLLDLDHPSLTSLLMYYKVVPRDLLNLAGSLSSELLPSMIEEANTTVNSAQQAKTKETKKWQPYSKFDEKGKIKIGKYSSESGIRVAVRHFLRWSWEEYQPKYRSWIQESIPSGTELETKNQRRRSHRHQPTCQEVWLCSTGRGGDRWEDMLWTYLHLLDRFKAIQTV